FCPRLEQSKTQQREERHREGHNADNNFKVSRARTRATLSSRVAGRYYGSPSKFPMTIDAYSMAKSISLQRHFRVLTKFAHVESRLSGRKRQKEVVFYTPVILCDRRPCSTSVAVGISPVRIGCTCCVSLHRSKPRACCGCGRGVTGLNRCSVP